MSLFNCLRQRFSDCALQSPGAPRRVFRAPWEFLAFIFQELCLRHLILLCPFCAGYKTMYLAKQSKSVCGKQSKNTAFLKIYVRGFVKLTVVIWLSALKKVWEPLVDYSMFQKLYYCCCIRSSLPLSLYCIIPFQKKQSQSSKSTFKINTTDKTF